MRMQCEKNSSEIINNSTLRPTKFELLFFFKVSKLQDLRIIQALMFNSKL